MRSKAPIALLTLFLTMGLSAIWAAVRLPSRWLPGDAAVQPAAREQVTPFVASGGANVLAVWSDGRGNSVGGSYGETSRDIYAMRF
ncbi:MAG TPA: hypothetical protein VFV33_00380, partial [Gemmatimonadaceae bacterium]|nr:hypothetical protein [Gemmatimonadaceae bacterium]